MDAAFWHERWELGHIAFDQAAPHRLLRRLWSSLDVSADTPVFVPLAGRSIDMVWLAERGHTVVGNELSARAVEQFFARVDLVPDVVARDQAVAHTAGPYRLWCGDFFAMTAGMVGEVGAVYDRASLVALPVDLRERYAAHLVTIVPVGAPVLLISLEYDDAEMDGPPFSVSRTEIERLFGRTHTMEVLAVEPALEHNPGLGDRGLTDLTETATVLHDRR